MFRLAERMHAPLLALQITNRSFLSSMCIGAVDAMLFADAERIVVRGKVRSELQKLLAGSYTAGVEFLSDLRSVGIVCKEVHPIHVPFLENDVVCERTVHYLTGGVWERRDDPPRKNTLATSAPTRHQIRDWILETRKEQDRIFNSWSL